VYVISRCTLANKNIKNLRSRFVSYISAKYYLNLFKFGTVIAKIKKDKDMYET